jgi:DNA-binding transcriptional LysR family regulator
MPHLPDLEGWAIFGKVAEAGSFVRAATELGLSKATVSKAVSRLERRLGERLFNRTSRRLSLTETGRVLSLRAARILTDAEAVEAEALAQSATPRGRVRLAAPMSFGLLHVAPALPDFLAAYPEISIELHLSDEILDLIGGGFDLALRIAALSDSSMLVRRLCEVGRPPGGAPPELVRAVRLVGAPEYFVRHGRPSHPRELSQHACLGYSYLPSRDRWEFAGPDGEVQSIAVRGPLLANNADALMPALRAGVGLAVQPEFVVWRDLQERRLEAVMTHWRAPLIALNIISPPGGPRPSKVAVLMDFLIRRYSGQSLPWDMS